MNETMTWAELGQQYQAAVSGETARVWRHAVKHFERICQPAALDGITESTLHHFVTVRLAEDAPRKSVQTQLGFVTAALKFGFDAGLLEPSRFAVKQLANGQWRWQWPASLSWTY